ncbi:MAG TPA: hypothetical protein DCM54_04345 [Gammaproteobacteria bacterium]|nr:hypothetical protein [Gammaproteobacteria bacterium]
MEAIDMVTIDSQVHTYERNHPGRPWVGFLHGPDEVTGDDMVAAMDAVGVDGALLVSPYAMYRYDASYAMEVYEKHPSRFGLIKPFNPRSETIDDDLSEWATTPGVVGARFMLAREEVEAHDPGVNNILQSGAKYGLPINILGWGKLDVLTELVKRNQNTQIVIDHLGLSQPFEPPAPEQPFQDLKDVLPLAEFDNVAIKISGACTLSHEDFPYPDIWPALNEMFEAFGLERCLWGTDWTRAINLLNYEQGVEAFRIADHLSDDEREKLMGRNLARIYDWSPGS